MSTTIKDDETKADLLREAKERLRITEQEIHRLSGTGEIDAVNAWRREKDCWIDRIDQLIGRK